jgi:glycosyltransferase involved in cell wall biosynthesis
MKLTVALCTYNPSEENLHRALDAIVAQLAEVPSTEVIVVDNNSHPSLAERQYLSDYPMISLIREPTPGLTAARETAITSARGDVIVFVDDDNILDGHYLAIVEKAFSADPTLGLLGGSIIPEYETSPPKWFDEFEPWLAVRRYPPELHVAITELPVRPPYTKYFPVGAGFATRRELALAHRDDCARTMRIEGRRGDVLSSGEDLDLGLFALSQGNKIAVSGALSLTHVISADRVCRSYLERLAAGSVKSSLELEQKWSPRFGRPVYPMLSMSLVELLARVVATTVLGFRSPRYRIKRAVYTALVRVRLHGRIEV